MKNIITQELKERVKRSFKNANVVILQTQQIDASRSELRAMERHGLLKSIQTFGDRKWVDVTPPKIWGWEIKY